MAVKVSSSQGFRSYEVPFNEGRVYSTVDGRDSQILLHLHRRNNGRISGQNLCLMNALTLNRNRNRNRNRKLKTSKALLKSQAHQGTSLFTSAATNQRGIFKGGSREAQVRIPEYQEETE